MDGMIMQAESGQSQMAVEGYHAAQETTGKSKVNYGRTVGNPELTKEGEQYYSELRKKYPGMEFVLVSEDMKAQTQAQAGQYANPGRMVVLIDTDKIERMAQDESYRKQYEGIIQRAAVQMSMTGKGFGANASSVKSYGMKVNDGGLTSFFAVVDQSMASQRERIAARAKKKAAEKKAAAKKDQKAAREKKLEEKRDARRREKKEAERSEDLVTVTASSWEELLRKVDEAVQAGMSDRVRTEEEMKLGQHIDFRW